MKRALELANRPTHSLLPNPRVGAVIVWQNRLVGEGFHLGPGTPHAEAMAIIEARKNGFRKFKEAELFVNLEPCISRPGKRTPPCAPLLVSTKFAKVHIAHLDPHSKVSGKGVRFLKQAQIPVELGLLEEEAVMMNQAYIKNQTKRAAYVRLKLAMTFDGKMALDNGVSKWITGPESRQAVHELRAGADAILTTAKTIEVDNPRLNVRLADSQKNPAALNRPILIWGRPKNLQKTKLYKIHGPENLFFSKPKESIQQFFKRIFVKGGVGDILVEAGPRFASALLAAKLVDEIHIFYGRGFIGGQGKHSLGRLWRPKSLVKSMGFTISDARLRGSDLHIKAYTHVFRPH